MSEIDLLEVRKKVPTVWNKTLSKMMYIQVRTLLETHYLTGATEVKPSQYNDYYGQVEIIIKDFYRSLIRSVEAFGYTVDDIKPTEDGKLRMFIQMKFNDFRDRYLDSRAH